MATGRKDRPQVFEEVLGQDIPGVSTRSSTTTSGIDGATHAGRGVSGGRSRRPVFGADSDGLEALRAMVLENPGSFPARLAFGQALFEEERFDEAEGGVPGGPQPFPEYGGPDGPYFFWPRSTGRRVRCERAARALQPLGYLNETLFQVHLEEAESGRSWETCRGGRGPGEGSGDRSLRRGGPPETRGAL